MMAQEDFKRPELPEHFNVAEHFLDRPAQRHSNRVAIAGEPREVTYGELAGLSNRVGNALLALGIFWHGKNRRRRRAGESLCPRR
jgi:acyl-coenzyme A synthetase/AMP-(fatty) acid ligase